MSHYNLPRSQNSAQCLKTYKKEDRRMSEANTQQKRNGKGKQYKPDVDCYIKGRRGEAGETESSPSASSDFGAIPVRVQRNLAERRKGKRRSLFVPDFFVLPPKTRNPSLPPHIEGNNYDTTIGIRAGPAKQADRERQARGPITGPGQC